MKKPSRYQMIVWRETVLLPIVEGRGLEEEYLPNAMQIGLYYYPFQKALKGWQRRLDADEPDWLSSGRRPELVRAAKDILETFEGPFTRYELAFEVDRLETVLARSRELEESAKAVTRSVQDAMEALRVQADEYLDRSSDLLSKLKDERQTSAGLQSLLAEANEWAQYSPDWAREKHGWDEYDRRVKAVLEPDAPDEGEDND